MECVLEVGAEGSEAVLLVRGEVDVDSAPQLEECLSLLVRAGVERICVDVGQVGFMDSSGLYVLVRCARQSRSRTSLVIRNPRHHVARLLSISRVERVVDIEWPEEGDQPPPEASPSPAHPSGRGRRASGSKPDGPDADIIELRR